MSEAYKIEGRIHKVLDTETFPSGFQKRILVVDTMGDYPQMIPIEFLKDRVTELDGLQEGVTIIVQANIRGNEYNGKYYVSLVGWKFNLDSVAAADMEQQAPAHSQTATQAAQPAAAQETDDIPFN